MEDGRLNPTLWMKAGMPVLLSVCFQITAILILILFLKSDCRDEIKCDLMRQLLLIPHRKYVEVFP